MPQIIIPADPFVDANAGKFWRERGHWPAFWIACPGADTPPLVTAYRLRFQAQVGGQARLHVTADERYELYLDGARIGRGPERGDPNHWFYQTYEVQLAAGAHVLAARVWSLGDLAAEYQMSVHPGFLLAAEGAWQEALSTGVAGWEARALDGFDFVPPAPAAWRDHRVRLDGTRYPWGAERGEESGGGWLPAVRLTPGVGKIIDWGWYRQHRLQPGTLPPQMAWTDAADAAARGIGRVRFAESAPGWETLRVPVQIANQDAGMAAAWQALLADGSPLPIPANSRQRVIVDLETYLCAYPEIEADGGRGGRVRLHWAESLRHQPDPWSADKGHRDAVEGKYFAGFGDEFLLAGGADRRVYAPLWWNAGRYIEIVVETGSEPLTIHRLGLVETRYPLEMESSFTCSDPRLNAALPLMVRGLQVDAHDAYFDTPYYEEHMYAGDTRLECLTTYVMARDDRLPRKAVSLFDASRLPSGFTQSRYPCRVTQVIPAWSLWWIGMVREYALWRGDSDFTRARLPGVRSTLQAFRANMGADGLLHAPEGWNNLDWVTQWDAEGGVPPDGIAGVSGPLNWQLVYVLGLAAALEDELGAAEQAAFNRRWARELAEQAQAVFWNEARGLLADDGGQQCYSEHSQVLALLANQHLPGLFAADRAERIGRGLRTDPDLAIASYHFMHYLFEAFRLLGDGAAIVARMAWWHERMVLKGLKTPLERLEPSRSDCHAWSSHPLYHYFATILGIRPVEVGFKRVAVTPLLGPLDSAEGVLVHPGGGEIRAQVRRAGDRLAGRITLPPGVSGVLRVNGEEIALEPGETGF